MIGKDGEDVAAICLSTRRCRIYRIRANGYLLHATTPSVSYVTRTENFDCGIMISASHNSFYDNGIKVITEKGHKLRQR